MKGQGRGEMIERDREGEERKSRREQIEGESGRRERGV